MAIDLDKNLLAQLDPKRSSDEVKRLALAAIHDDSSSLNKEKLASVLKKTLEESLRSDLLSSKRGKKKTASAGDSAGAGAALGALVPGISLLTSPLGAAIGAQRGARKQPGRKPDPKRVSPELQAALGAVIGKGAGGVSGGLTGMLLGRALAKKLKLSPEQAASLGAVTLAVPASVYGAYKGAKIGAERPYKSKKASATLSGLRYASAASYQSALEKNAFVGRAFKAVKGYFNPSLSQRIAKGAGNVGDAFFGGMPVKGATKGGFLGGGFGLAKSLRQLQKAQGLASKKINDDAFKEHMKRVSEVKLKDPTDYTAADRALLEFDSQVRAFKKGDLKTPGDYLMKFGPGVAKEMFEYGGLGAAGGAAAQEAARAATRAKVKDLATGVLPIAGIATATGLGGLALGSMGE